MRRVLVVDPTPDRRPAHAVSEEGGPVRTGRENEIERLTRRVAELEQIVAIAVPAQKGKLSGNGRPIPDVDSRWKCAKCHVLLAFYDPATEVLRMRIRDQVVYVKIGEGGWLQAICPSCGEPNEQRWASPEELEAVRRAEVEKQAGDRRPLR